MLGRVAYCMRPGYGAVGLVTKRAVSKRVLPAQAWVLGAKFASTSSSPSNSESKAGVETPAASKPVPAPAKGKKEKKPPLWDRIKHELNHYVNGTKLLGYEIKVSTKLLIKFIQGYELSRREKNQLKRTMSDVFRLIPFSAFLIIPFAELLLPVALKIFPNLLPSTYESGKEKSLKRTKLNEIRAKTSNFIQETLEESSLISYNSLESTEKKKQFLNFFKKLNSPKDGRENVFTHEEILAVAKMFKNDTVLDNLSRPQLIAMAKYMSLRPFGNDNLLRYQIRLNLKNTMADDKTIDYEGVNSLSDEELYQACVSRGIKTFGVSRDVLVENLKVWLELRLRHQVPSVLLILSSAYTFGGIPKEQKVDAFSTASIENKVEDTKFNNLLDFYYDGILQVLSSIPDPVYNVAKLDVSESKKSTSDVKEATKEHHKEPSIGELASEALATSSASAAAAATATATATASAATTHLSNATSSVSGSHPSVEPVATKPSADHDVKKAETLEPGAQPSTEEQKNIQGETEEEPEETEESTATDDNAFKLSVLKEQDELIKKEEEEARLRSHREVIKDDISLDENEDESSTPDDAKSTEPEKEKNSEQK